GALPSGSTCCRSECTWPSPTTGPRPRERLAVGGLARLDVQPPDRLAAAPGGEPEALRAQALLRVAPGVVGGHQRLTALAGRSPRRARSAGCLHEQTPPVRPVEQEPQLLRGV